MREDAIELTALVVTRDREVDVVACVASLLAAISPRSEIVVVENGATPAVHAAIAAIAARDPRVRPLAIPATSPSLARNDGVRAARGALVFFLDDDVIVPASVPRHAVDLMAARPDVGIAGGPNLTPDDDPELARLFGAILESRFGTGIAVGRYVRRPASIARESDLVLCNLLVRRRLLDGGLAFPKLFGGEENVLMGHAEDRGVRLFYDPELAVHHRRRRTFAGHVEQVHRYGVGRANAMFTAPRTFRVAYLVPSAFVLYLLALPVAATLGPVVFAPLGVYLGLAAGAALAVAIRHRRASFAPRAFLLFPVTHVAYGVGLITRSLEMTRQRLRRDPQASGAGGAS